MTNEIDITGLIPGIGISPRPKCGLRPWSDLCLKVRGNYQMHEIIQPTACGFGVETPPCRSARRRFAEANAPDWPLEMIRTIPPQGRSEI